MKSTQDTDRTSQLSEPNGYKAAHMARGIHLRIFIFLKSQQEMFVFVALGTSLILSALFLFACLRSMIPVDGIHNWTGERIGGDFIVFYSGTLLALGGAAASAYDQTVLNAYQLDILGIEPRNLPWRYPPIYFLFLFPLTFFSYLSAFWTWTVLTISVLMVVVRKITSIWYLPLLVPMCLPVAYSMVAGQNGNFTAVLIGAGLIMLNRSGIVAGIIFGLLAYKPQIAVVIPFCLLAGRNYRVLISMAITVISLVLLSWFVYGAEPWVSFFQGLFPQTNSAFGSALDIWERIPTVIILTLQLFDSAMTAWVIQGFVAVLSIIFAAWVWRSSANLPPRALALVAAIPLASPYVWDYDMAMLIIPIAFLTIDTSGRKIAIGRLMLLLSMWLAEPTLRVLSGKTGLQLGPFLWATMLTYSVFLVKQEKEEGKPSENIAQKSNFPTAFKANIR